MWRGYSLSTVLHVTVVVVLLLGLPALPGLLFEEPTEKEPDDPPPPPRSGLRYGADKEGGLTPGRDFGESIGSAASKGEVSGELTLTPGQLTADTTIIPVLMLPEAPDNGGRKAIATALRQFSPAAKSNKIIRDPDKRDDKGLTALMRAAWNGHIDVVNKLLQGGAEVDLQDPEGRTALDHAQRELNKDVIERLLAAAPLHAGAAP